MSYFISSMFSPGFREMPPESNVIPFPTRASKPSDLVLLRRRVLQNDQLRRLVRAARHAQERAHAELFHLLLIQHIELQPELFGDLLSRVQP